MSGRISLSRKHAQALCVFYERVIHGKGSPFLPYSNEMDAADALRSALTPSPKKVAATKARKAAKGAKRATKRERTAAIYDAVAKRADGKCEACGGEFLPMDGPELDHIFGRGHIEQSVENCWFIHRFRCHREKTANRPRAAYWLHRALRHFDRHGYTAEASRARARLASLSDVAEAAALTGGRHV